MSVFQRVGGAVGAGTAAFSAAAGAWAERGASPPERRCCSSMKSHASPAVSAVASFSLIPSNTIRIAIALLALRYIQTLHRRGSRCKGGGELTGARGVWVGGFCMETSRYDVDDVSRCY